jgi:ferredoxin
MTLSRRDLFGLLRGRRDGATPDEADALPSDQVDTGSSIPATSPVDGDAPQPGPNPPSDPGFSLDAFYAARTAVPALPPFAIRATVTTETTRVGVGPITARREPAAGSPVARIPAELVPDVLPHRCIATRSFCSVCSERCPAPGAIVVERGRPRIEPARCDGCGECIAACPAPILAFALVSRPKATP